MRWLIDGYNVIRRAPELSSRERLSLEAGRRALIDLLGEVAVSGGDQFTVVFDGAGPGGGMGSGAGVRIVFSSARESADRVLARMAAQGGAVVSNDREVRRAAARAGAIAITADQFLARLESGPRRLDRESGEDPKDASERRSGGAKKGNPRRLGKKARAAARALGRLRPG
jgi:predicted RNA-binding protein with PIN domain